MGVTIINGALSKDKVHMFVEIPPQVFVGDFVRPAKGRSSRKLQQEFEHIRKRYRGETLLAKGLLLDHFRQHHPMSSSCGISTSIPKAMASAHSMILI